MTGKLEVNPAIAQPVDPDCDIFVSVALEGAITRDWCDEILTLDLNNSKGERFHWEILPGDKDKLSTRASAAPGSKEGERGTIVNFESNLFWPDGMV